jgi:hypothetical protein
MQVLHSVSVSSSVSYDASVPEQLGALCNAATARDRAARPKDAAAFREHIAEFLQRRSALALSDAASERLELLERLLAGATPDAAPSDLSTAYRLASEARFGFVQSLREHPRHDAAIAGLRAALLALVELEIRQKHADTAEALLREVDSPDPTFSARLAAVRAEDETRRREAARLEAIDHDLDPTVSAAPRAVMVRLLILLVAALTVVAVTSGGEITRLKTVLFAGVFAAATLMGSVVARKQLMVNAFNRKLAALMVCLSLLVVGERVVAYFSEVPVPRIFATDLWISAAAVGVAAITLRSRLWVGVVPCIVGAILAASFPDHAPNIFAASVVAAFVLTGLALRPTAARRSGP